MSEYRETRTVVEDVPIKRARPVVDTQHESVVHEHRGISGGEVAALVLAALAVGVVVTLLILNNQQRDADDQLAQERARAAAAEQAAAQPAQQPPQQPPPVVVMPQTQPGVAPVPVPAPTAPTVPATTAPTSTELELGVTTKLTEDQELRSYPIDVKVIGGTAMLSGHVPTQELKIQAEKLARTVRGIRNVANSIVVKPE